MDMMEKLHKEALGSLLGKAQSGIADKAKKFKGGAIIMKISKPEKPDSEMEDVSEYEKLFAGIELPEEIKKTIIERLGQMKS